MRIRFRISYTWILAFALVTVMVTTQFSEDFPLVQRVVIGVAVSLLFLLAAILRELVLSPAAFHSEASIKQITLYPFGGVYQENQEKIASTHRPLLFAARFLFNLILTVLFYALYATFVSADYLTLAGLAQWLSYIYLLLFLLNFLPAFPLDGGQILRLYLWKSAGDYYTATRTASLIGWSIGLFLIFAGVLVFILTLQWISSLPLVMIGWFVEIAAGNARRDIKTLMTLQNIKAQDIMTCEYINLPPRLKIGEVIREHLLTKGWNYAVVAEASELKGIVTLRQIKSVPWKRWNYTSLGEIMTASDQFKAARPQEPACAVLEEMDQRKVDYIPVLDEGRVRGVVARDTLINLARVRAGFGV